MITDDTLRDAYLLPHSWENDERLVVMARDMDPLSTRRGELLYAGTRETFASLEPVHSNIPAATTVGVPATWVEGRGWISEPAPYTFERGDLVGWFARDITAGFNRSQLPALELATDWEAAWGKFLGDEPVVIPIPDGVHSFTVPPASDAATAYGPLKEQLNFRESQADVSERLFERSQAEPPKPRDAIMRFFAHAHLPPHLSAVSAPFGDLAEKIHAEIPASAERTVALRKLLEAKDAAVRAILPAEGA